MDRSVYYFNGGIRIKEDKVIINLYGTKSFLDYDAIVNVDIQSSDDSNELNLLVTTNNKDKFVFEGENDLLEDSLFIKKYINDKVRFIQNSSRDLKFSSISEYYYVKGDIQQETFVSPDDKTPTKKPFPLKKNQTPNKPSPSKPRLKKPTKLFGKNTDDE